MIKLMNRLMSVSLLSLLLITNTAPKASAQDVTVSYQEFYDQLSPYGQWVYDPQYGNVWVPSVGGNFRPYGSEGYWVMTDYGNTWVSDYPWGWACFHYGRWTYDPYYGWIWMPGYEWAPAWVSWRYGGGYCGWAPLGPGVSISVGYGCPDSWWVFVGPEYMYHHDCLNYWRGPRYNTTFIRQTTIVNNYYVDNGTHVRYNYGPRAETIERDTHQPVQVMRISQSNRPGEARVSGNRVAMYRPAVNRGSIQEARPANVIQAPHAIASRPQPATNMSASRTPQFHQDLPRLAPQRQMPQQQQRQMQQQQRVQQEQQRQMPQQQQRMQQEQQRQMPQQQQQRVQQEQQQQRQMQQQQQQRMQQEQQRQMPQQQQQRVQQEQQQQRQMQQQQQQRMQQEQQRQMPQQQQQRMQQEQQQQRQMQQQQQQQRMQQEQQQQRQMQQQQQQRQMQQEQQRQMQMQQQRQMQQQPRPMPQPQPRPAPAPRQAPPPQQHEGGGRR